MAFAVNSSSNCTMPFDSREFIIVAILRAASGFASVLCSSYSILLIVAFKRYLLSFQRIALCFCISSVLKGLSDATNRVDYVLTNSATNNYCIWSGFYLQYTLWTLFLSILFFVSCSIKKIAFNKEFVRLERLVPFIIFAVPLTFNWIPFLYSTYGRSELLCWIRDINEDCSGFAFGLWLQYVLWMVPQVVLLVATTIVYFAGSTFIICCQRKWTSRPPTDSMNGEKKESVILLLFPIIFAVLNIPNFTVSVVQTLYVTSSSNNPLVPLWYLYGVFTPLAPGILSLLYATNFQRVSCGSFVTGLKSACAGICGKRKVIYDYPIEQTVEQEELEYSLLKD